MSVVVKTVESRKDLRIFVKFPLSLYEGCPYYVPNLYLDDMKMLDPAKNAMGKYSVLRKFLAYKDGKLVGRVAAIINKLANEKWGHKEVRFGWIDFVDDREVSKALIDAVIAFGKENGMETIAGPLGFTDFDSEGCVVEEGVKDISSFALKYNYPYYKEHFEALGMTKVNDWLEYRIMVPNQVPPKVVKAAKLVSERYGLRMRKLTKKEVLKGGYGRKLFELVNKAYSNLFDYTVLPPEVADQYVDSFLGLLDMKYLPVVEDSNGNIVGMALTMPSPARATRKCKGFLFPLGWWYLIKSLYIKHEDAAEMLLIAVDPDQRNHGIHAMLFNDVIGCLIEGGFKYGESNAEMESNAAIQNVWNDYEKIFMRRRRVFGKEI